MSVFELLALSQEFLPCGEDSDNGVKAQMEKSRKTGSSMDPGNLQGGHTHFNVFGEVYFPL